MSPESQDDGPAGMPRRVVYRRRPRLVSFLVVGALVGTVVGGLLGWTGPQTPGSSRMQDVILLGALAGALGAFLGSIVYLVADQISLRGRR